MLKQVQHDESATQNHPEFISGSLPQGPHNLRCSCLSTA